MKKSTAIAVAIAAAIVAVVTIVVIVLTNSGSTTPPASAPSSALADDSHVLDEGDSVVLVEFLDFECPACAAFEPHVDALRSELAGRLTYAVRYFPLPGHPNSVTAAIAVEAAARQDRFEDMADLLFERQADWAGVSNSQAPLFREYAEELGLDLEQFDADVADPAVLERIEADVAAGIALGVQSTPSFFLDDELVSLQRFEDLRNAVASAID